jgi:hypothetical protein
MSAGSNSQSRTGQLVREIRIAVFPLAWRGYQVQLVDDWLESVAASIASGEIAGDPFRSRPEFGRSLRGYERRAVAAFIDKAQRSYQDMSGQVSG